MDFIRDNQLSVNFQRSVDRDIGNILNCINLGVFQIYFSRLFERGTRSLAFESRVNETFVPRIEFFDDQRKKLTRSTSSTDVGEDIDLRFRVDNPRSAGTDVRC